MLAQYLDITDQLLLGSASVETSNYDYCILQIISAGGTQYNFTSTLNSDAWPGVSDGNITSSLAYTTIVGTDLSDNTLKTDTSGADGLWRFNVVGRYIRFGLVAGTPTAQFKALIMLAKIS